MMVDKYDIEFVPTFVYVVRGKEKRRKVGVLTESMMKRMCRD